MQQLCVFDPHIICSWLQITVCPKNHRPFRSHLLLKLNCATTTLRESVAADTLLCSEKTEISVEVHDEAKEQPRRARRLRGFFALFAAQLVMRHAVCVRGAATSAYGAPTARLVVAFYYIQHRVHTHHDQPPHYWHNWAEYIYCGWVATTEVKITAKLYCNNWPTP